MARVAVVGVGAIGGTLAGQLEVTGQHEITLCTRRPMESLTVRMPDRTVVMQARNLTDPAKAEPVDWVLVATKTYDAEATGTWLQGLCREGAPVAVIQNGVEHRERFAPYVDPVRIMPVIIDTPAEREEDGTVVQRGEARMHVETGALGEGFAELFRGSSAVVELEEDFLTAAWRKLCLNSAGALNALTLRPAGVFRDEAIAAVAIDMVEECGRVARAEGARIDEEIGQRVLAIYRTHPEDAVNSLLADRRAGRRMEIAARNGVIVRLGEKHGIATPANRMAWAVLQSL